MKSPPSRKTIYHVPNRLGLLTAKPGGRTRHQALSTAQENVETLREDGVATILESIAEVEMLVRASASPGASLSWAERQHLLDLAGPLLTLTGTFGFDLLDAVVKSLCDLLQGMDANEQDGLAPIIIHVQAMRLCAPDEEPLSGEDAHHMLTQLERVLIHFGCKRKVHSSKTEPSRLH